MPFITASYYDTGSYISGTIDSFSYSDILTYFVSASDMTKVPGNLILTSFNLAIPGPSSHGSRPVKL